MINLEPKAFRKPFLQFYKIVYLKKNNYYNFQFLNRLKFKSRFILITFLLQCLMSETL